GAATATSGAHGLAARAVTAAGRGVPGTACGSGACGSGGGPAGRPLVIDADATSDFFTTSGALLPADSSAPCSIHFLSVESWTSGSGSALGGIFGSALWAASM